MLNSMLKLGCFVAFVAVTAPAQAAPPAKSTDRSGDTTMVQLEISERQLQEIEKSLKASNSAYSSVLETSLIKLQAEQLNVDNVATCALLSQTLKGSGFTVFDLVKLLRIGSTQALTRAVSQGVPIPAPVLPPTVGEEPEEPPRKSSNPFSPNGGP